MKEKHIITKSWGGYTIPPKPGPPIPYSEAEGLSAYSVFTFNELNQIVKFRKYLIHTEPYKSQIFFLPQETLGRSFYSNPINNNEKPMQITIEQTINLDSYIRAERTGKDMLSMLLIKKEIMFDHDYTYWSNGKLKSCAYKNSSEEGFIVGIDHYDENGSQIIK